jgi:hypothetical protein
LLLGLLSGDFGLFSDLLESLSLGFQVNVFLLENWDISNVAVAFLDLLLGFLFIKFSLFYLNFKLVFFILESFTFNYLLFFLNNGDL